MEGDVAQAVVATLERLGGNGKLAPVAEDVADGEEFQARVLMASWPMRAQGPLRKSGLMPRMSASW